MLSLGVSMLDLCRPLALPNVKRCITEAENIKGGESTSLFLTPYSQSPMDDADKVIILNITGPGIDATGAAGARCKDVRLRAKRLGVRKEGWT